MRPSPSPSPSRSRSRSRSPSPNPKPQPQSQPWPRAGCDCEAALYEADATSAAHRDLARRVGAASAVLLKNEEGTLPLRPGARVVLVGLRLRRSLSLRLSLSLTPTVIL